MTKEVRKKTLPIDVKTEETGFAFTALLKTYSQCFYSAESCASNDF